jgi:Na+/H+-dicarboxylate symporter
LVFAVLNGAAHLFLIGYSIFKDLPSGELLCLLMLSAAVGMVSMGLSEKHKKTEEGV